LRRCSVSDGQWESTNSWDQRRIPEYHAGPKRPYRGPDTSAQLVALDRLQDVGSTQRGERTVSPIGRPTPGVDKGAHRSRHLDDVFEPHKPRRDSVTAASMSRRSDTATGRYATPPSDREKYSYLRGGQKRWFILVQYIAFISVIISFAGFALSSYETFIFGIPLVVYAAEQTLSLYTSTRPRRIDLASHQQFVGNWFPRRYAAVDVFVPTAGEDLDLLDNTMRYMTFLEWPGELNVFVLDDSGRAAVRRLAEKYGLNYLARPGSEYKKAGNLRYAAERTNGDVIVIFDADFVPRHDFLVELVPYMDDPAVGIVQSPQFFDTAKQMNWVQRCAGSTQELFYRFLQPSRDALGAAVCVGTSALYRRVALDAVGGFPLIGTSEDIFTGLYMSDAGYSIRYVPVLLSKGLTPDNLDNFIAQQYRWCEGSMTMIATMRFHTTPYLPLRARLCFWSGFLYYVSTALSALIIPLPTIVMTWLFPEWVRSWNTIWLAGALASWLIIYPLVMRSRWRVEVLRLQTVYGFAHLFNIVDLIQNRVVEWHPTGSKAPAPIATRVKRFYTIYLGLALTMAAVGLTLRIAEDGLSTFAGMLLFFLINLYVAGPLVASGIVDQHRTRQKARAPEAAADPSVWATA
jgi:cellulose synthase (UDP-forming)